MYQCVEMTVYLKFLIKSLKKLPDVESRKYCVQIYFVESRYQKNLLK